MKLHTLKSLSEYQSMFKIEHLKSTIYTYGLVFATCLLYMYSLFPFRYGDCFRIRFILEPHKTRAFSFLSDPLLVLIEYVPYGDLLGYLRKSRGLNDTYFNSPDRKPETNLTSKQLMRFAWQIADGMAYLSSRKVKTSIIFAIL